MTKYDYIILGAGASGLMLAYRMAKDDFFDDKSILIIDKFVNKGNDRTWCYWEDGEGEWDNILSKSWSSIYFGSKSFSKTIDILPYTYKMIRSVDFYDSLWKVINKASQISFVNTGVKTIKERENDVSVETDKDTYLASKVFNSIAKPDIYNSQKKHPVLQQHFLGWFVETEDDCFDDSTATFMDFSVEQNGNTRFMYVLPITKNKALFEYTLFSKNILETSDYERSIVGYLNNKNITKYNILEKEKGSIPMTAFNFSKLNTNRILNIGTAGGWTKASTGYTFRNTAKNTSILIDFLKSKKKLTKFKRSSKFAFYDLIFLDVLANNNQEGAQLFTSMFKKTNVKTIFKFLDEESTILEDLKIILSVPPKRFIQALLKRIF